MRSVSMKSRKRKSCTSSSFSGPPIFNIRIPVLGFLQMKWMVLTNGRRTKQGLRRMGLWLCCSKASVIDGLTTCCVCKFCFWACDQVISQQALRKWVFNCTCSLESLEWVNWQTQLPRPSTVVWETHSCTDSRRDCVWPLTNTQHEETLSCQSQTVQETDAGQEQMHFKHGFADQISVGNNK